MKRPGTAGRKRADTAGGADAAGDGGAGAGDVSDDDDYDDADPAAKGRKIAKKLQSATVDPVVARIRDQLDALQ